MVLGRAVEARARAREAAAQAASVIERSERQVRGATVLVADAASLRDDLARAVRAYAHELRLLDTPPERALVLVKAMVDEELAKWSPDKRALMEDVARWCIDGYYAA